MAYKVIILYRLYMPSYFLGTFTEYPYCCFSLFPHIYDVRKKSDDRLKRPRIKSPAKQFTPASIR